MPFVCDGYRRDLKPKGSTDLPGANRNGRRPARRAKHMDVWSNPLGDANANKRSRLLVPFVCDGYRRDLKPKGSTDLQGANRYVRRPARRAKHMDVWSNPLGDAILKSADRLVTIPALACVWNLCHYGRFPADLANGWLLTII